MWDRARRVCASSPCSTTPLISPLFWAVIETTEEAIVNALIAVETMTGIDGITARALPHDRLREIMARHAAVRRFPSST